MTTETFVVTSSGKSVILKDPDAILDYSFDWIAWLALSDNDEHLSHSFVPDPTIAVQSSFEVDGVVTAMVSGGNPGAVVPLTCRIVTVGGRTDDRTIYLKIQDR